MFANLRRQNGSIGIVMLSTMIVLGVFLETTGFRGITESKKTLVRTRTKDGRNSIAFQVERHATLATTFRNSLASPENSDLRNCILGTSAVLCNGNGEEYPLSLYSPATEAGFTTPLLIAGSSSSAGRPALYDGNGQLCKTGATRATPACPFEVYTTFKARCPVATGSPCAKAEAIQVRIQIKIPKNIASMVETKGRFILSDVDKLAAEIQTAAILPPPFGFIPNRITKANLIGETTTTTTITTIDGVKSYDEALALIKAAMGADTSRAVAAADYIYNNYKLTSPTLISALAAQWNKNVDIAKGLTHFTWWATSSDGDISPSIIDQIAAAAASATSDPYTQTALAKAAIRDPATAQKIANAMVGISNEFAIDAIAHAWIMDSKTAQAVASALGIIGSTSSDFSHPLAAWANSTKTTDVAKIIAYGTSSDFVPYAAVKLEESPATYTTTTTTVTTETTSSSPSMGSLIKACSSATNCGTQIGL